MGINVNLTPQLEELVRSKVASGLYTSASEVVREALRLLEDHDRARSAQLQEFNEQLQRCLTSLDRGEHADPAVVRRNLKKKSDQLRKRRA